MNNGDHISMSAGTKASCFESSFAGKDKRVLLYSHDTLGMGHLRRTLKISQALKDAYSELSVLIVTGSPVAEVGMFPVGVDFVKLPAVKKLDDETYVPRSLGGTIDELVALRSELILAAARNFDPHLTLIDHAPLGMKGEILATLKWFKNERPKTTVCLGLRDIVDDPERIRSRWSEGTYQTLEDYYQRIFVYGDPTVFDPVSAYDFPQSLREKTSFLGYISEPPPETVAPSCSTTKELARPFVIVSVGGGDYYGPEVIENYLQMLKRYQTEITFDSLIIAGPLMPISQVKQYQRLAQGLPAEVRGSDPDLKSHLTASSLALTTGGYNSSVEVLSFARRAIIVPRVTMRREQSMRAERLEEMGLIEMILPERITSERLFESVRSHLNQTDSPLEKARTNKLLNMAGSEAVAIEFGRILWENHKVCKELS